MEAGGVRGSLRDLAGRIDADTPHALSAAASIGRSLVHKAGMTAPLRRALLDAYHRLGERVSVAVRSSATMEDAAGSSFAGMNETFTNVAGDDELVERVVRCWMSAWAERVLAYRASQKIERRAGDRGGGAADGRCRSRRRHVHRRPGDGRPPSHRRRGGLRARRGRRRRSGRARHLRSGQGRIGAAARRSASAKRPTRSCAARTAKTAASSSAQRSSASACSATRSWPGCASSALRIERHYGAPQDIEWAIEGPSIFIVQSRPITTLARPGADARGWRDPDRRPRCVPRKRQRPGADTALGGRRRSPAKGRRAGRGDDQP